MAKSFTPTPASKPYRTKPGPALVEAAQKVHDGFVATANFPVGTITEAGFQAQISGFSVADAKVKGGSTADTANRNNLKVALCATLDTLADFTDQNSGGDPAFILGVGFDHTATSRTAAILVQAVINKIVNPASTQLQVLATAVPGAKGYWGQVRIGTGAWSTPVFFSSTRNMVFTGLVPGTLYDVRICALGANNAAGEWSDVVSHMCM